jgi:hypothetical protein
MEGAGQRRDDVLRQAFCSVLDMMKTVSVSRRGNNVEGEKKEKRRNQRRKRANLRAIVKEK